MKSRIFQSGLVRTVLIALVGLAFLGLGLFNQYYKGMGFRSDAAIAGIAVAGFTQEETGNLLQQQLTRINNLPVVFVYEGSEDHTTLGALIKPLQMETAIAAAWSADRSRSWHETAVNLIAQRTINYPLPLEYDSAATDALLRKWNDKWAVPFRDAVLEMDKNQGLVVSPGQAGMSVDKKATFEVLPAELKYIPERLDGNIVMEQHLPKIDEETLRYMGEITHYTTKYNVNEINRTHNLAKAANIINGSIILPGEIFSFNQTVGRRTMESGYKDAMVIVNGKFEPGLGGGICQVSSTIYNACLLAGLEIVERHYHNLTVAYVPLGQDATVSYGTQDFKFKNNTTAPIYVRAAAAGGYLTINIYGDTNFKQKIKISNLIDQTTPFQSVTIKDDSLQPGETKLDHSGQNGFVVRSFRIFYDQNGEQTQSESLGRSVYSALNNTVLVGPSVEDELAPEPGAAVEGEKPAEKPITPAEGENSAEKPIISTEGEKSTQQPIAPTEGGKPMPNPTDEVKEKTSTKPLPPNKTEGSALFDSPETSDNDDPQI